MRVALKCKGLYAAVSSWSCGLVVCAVHAHAHMQSVVPPPPPQQRSRSPVRRSSSRSSWIEYIVRRVSNQHQSDKRPPSFRFATPVRVWHIQCASGGAVYPITPPPPSPQFGERSLSANVSISSQDNLPYRVTFLCMRALRLRVYEIAALAIRASVAPRQFQWVFVCMGECDFSEHNTHTSFSVCAGKPAHHQYIT